MRAFKPHAITLLYGIAAERIAEMCGCHVTTARRWKRGEEPPKSALEIVELKSTGNLGLIDAAWAGWKLTRGMLVGPDQTEFRPADVLAGPFWRRLAHAYQDQQKMPQQSDWIDLRWSVNEVASG